MTEPKGIVPSTRELPLFPLSTVLFPGASLPLHIFEQRYRSMVRQCLSRRDPEFGVLLIKEGEEVVERPGDPESPGRPPEPYPVGTVARIVDAGRFPDGRYLIHCIGQERIRLRRMTQEEPFYVGEVEPLFDEDALSEDAARADLAGGVRQAVTTLLDAVREASPSGENAQRLQIDAVQRALPTDAGELSFFVPRLLGGASAEERQRLLDSRTLVQRLRLEQRLLARERQHVLRLKRAGTPVRFEVGVVPPSQN